MIFNRQKKINAEIERKGKENLDSYISYFPADKMKFQYEPFILELAGARYYKNDNLGFLFKQGEQVLLFQEPDNVHDKNAVKVVNLRGQQIGHMPKDFTKEIGKDLENGYYYKVIIDSIIDDLLYPYISLKLIRHSDTEEIKVTDEELKEFWDKRNAEKEKREENFNKSFELSQTGREYESEGEIEKSIEYFEKAIEYKEAPPIAFTRLTIHYRKNKDYDNEIRVINKWLETYVDSPANQDVIDYKTDEIKKRLEKAIELKEKNEK